LIFFKKTVISQQSCIRYQAGSIVLFNLCWWIDYIKVMNKWSKMSPSSYYFYGFWKAKTKSIKRNTQSRFRILFHLIIKGNLYKNPKYGKQNYRSWRRDNYNCFYFAKSSLWNRAYT